MAVGYARFAAVSLGVLLASTAVTGAALIFPPNPLSDLLLPKEQVLPGIEIPLAEEGPPRNARVRAELARLSEHPWAGTYRSVGEHGEDPVELVIAPEAGFTVYKDTDCGNCSRFVALGKVLTVEDSTLKLEVELAEPDDTFWFGLDDTLHLVRWGELVFAVPASRLELFCAEASDGATFPYVPFRYAGAPGDLENPPRPTGKPAVPSAFEHLLLDAPIAGKITALAEWRRRPALDGEEQQAYDALFALDVGADEGLVVGMHLFVPGAQRPDRFSGRVEAVERDSARLQLLVYDDRREWARGLVGTPVSTRAPAPKAR